jgi:hypothetical protein
MEKIKQALSLVKSVVLIVFKVAKRILKIVVEETIELLQKLLVVLGE